MSDPTSTEPLDVVVADGIATLTLRRPDAMNSMNQEMLDGLARALQNLPDADALVITGAGGTFCPGADLNYARAALETEDRIATMEPMVDALHAAIRAIKALPIPIIAAVDGPAVGAGLGLALACDLRVLGKTARLVAGYMRIGASPDGGVSWLLTRIVGSVRATSILLQGRPIGPQQALALGLADVVVDEPGETALGTATSLARSLVGAAPRSLMAVRELTERATANTLDEHLDLERAKISEIWQGADFVEGISAFLEKRPPRFTGS